jgi:hypothetical protein
MENYSLDRRLARRAIAFALEGGPIEFENVLRSGVLRTVLDVFKERRRRYEKRAKGIPGRPRRTAQLELEDRLRSALADYVGDAPGSGVPEAVPPWYEAFWTKARRTIAIEIEQFVKSRQIRVIACRHCGRVFTVERSRAFKDFCSGGCLARHKKLIETDTGLRAQQARAYRERKEAKTRSN